jgi:hypothetical protein
MVREDHGEQEARTTRDRVAEFLSAGDTETQIARRLVVSKPTVCYHARRLGYPASASTTAGTTGARCSSTTTPATPSANAESTSDSPIKLGTTR